MMQIVITPTGPNSADLTVKGYERWHCPVKWHVPEGREAMIACAKYALEKKINELNQTAPR